MKNILISTEPENIIFLKKNGINRSEFFRQSLEAYKIGKFAYDKSKQK